MEKTKYQLIQEVWKEGSKEAVKKLMKEKGLVECFAYHCMGKLEKQSKGDI